MPLTYGQVGGTAQATGRDAAGPVPRRYLPISSIERDPEMQHRLTPDPGLISEYAALMGDGTEFPPVIVWWDGQSYWLSDGFRRVAAAQLAGLSTVRAEIRTGTRQDALWDSYAANSTHGARRQPAETERVIRLALLHPASAGLSNVQIAKHLHVAEATVRRWRSRLSSPREEHTIRMVTRGGRTYCLSTEGIGRRASQRSAARRRDLRAEVGEMKGMAQVELSGLLNIVDHWVRGRLSPAECVLKLRQAVAARCGERRQEPPQAGAAV
jgi:transposase